jgi:hypothetical protein
MESGNADWLNSKPLGNLAKLPKRFRVLRNISYTHPKLGPAALEISEKALGLFAKRAT